MSSSRRRPHRNRPGGRRQPGKRLPRGRPSRVTADPPDRPVDQVLRWTAGTVTVVVAMLAAAATETLAYRDTDSTLFRNAGLRTLVLCLVIIVVGALSQAPIAARRRAAIRPGLLAAAAFVAYLLLVAGCAAGTVGQEGPLAGGSRWSPERLYQAVVFCLLGGPVLMALGGFIYVAPDDPTPLRHRIWMSTLVGWVFAVPLAVWLGFRLVA